MENLTIRTKFILGLQHVLAMFGATILVPYLTGLNPSISLICAGLGTLIFHLVTKRMVPVFLGSSFAFIGATALLFKNEGLAILKGGIIAAGIVYVIISLIILKFGVDKIKSLFPPVVVGPIIMVIGLRLSPTALSMIGYNNNSFEIKNLIVAFSVIITMIIVSSLKKSFFKLVPILIAIFVGYIVSYMLGILDFSGFKEASWIGLSTESLNELLTMPKFTISGILAIAPISLVVLIEHIGDISTNGAELINDIAEIFAVVGKDFFKNPGVHRTLLGDGIATILAGILGGPANTTYGENTGVLAVTKVYDPQVLRIAACFSIVLGLIGKFSVILQSIPQAVMGGVSVILFGMISAVGARTMVDAKLDFGHSRNLLIVSLICVLGIGIGEVNIYDNISVSGLALASLFGVFLNKILPEDK